MAITKLADPSQIKIKFFRGLMALALFGPILFIIFSPDKSDISAWIIVVIAVSFASLSLLVSIKAPQYQPIFMTTTVALLTIVGSIDIYGGTASGIPGSWLLTVPAIAFLLLGRKWGMFWSVLAVSLLVVGYLLPSNEGKLLNPDQSFVLAQLAMVLIFIISTVYVYQTTSDRYERRLAKEGKLLEETNKKLLRQIELFEQAEAEKTESINKLERLNDTLIGRELKMIELKEQLASNTKKPAQTANVETK